ncbi:MAG: hypothetical protein U1E53_04755 [Dongiaceae bacterium]
MLNDAEGGTVSQSPIAGNRANYNSQGGIIGENIAGFEGRRPAVDRRQSRQRQRDQRSRAIVPADRERRSAGRARDRPRQRRQTGSARSGCWRSTATRSRQNGAPASRFGNGAAYNAWITQAGEIAGNLVDHNSGDGIGLFNRADPARRRAARSAPPSASR